MASQRQEVPDLRASRDKSAKPPDQRYFDCRSPGGTATHTKGVGHLHSTSPDSSSFGTSYVDPPARVSLPRYVRRSHLSRWRHPDESSIHYEARYELRNSAPARRCQLEHWR